MTGRRKQASFIGVKERGASAPSAPGQGRAAGGVAWDWDAVSLLPLLLLIVPPGGQALHRVALHVQDALELLGLPLIRQGDGLLREHCRKARGRDRAALSL